MASKNQYVVIVGDGMADQPVPALEDRTPLAAARTPHMDGLAGHAEIGLVSTIPDGFTPGSDIANMTILGYDPRRYPQGRGPLEALAMGIGLDADALAFRCNLVTLVDGRMEDYCAGHITTEEAAPLIADLHKHHGSDRFRFHAGVGYRHLLITPASMESIACTPPHDILGQPVENHLPQGDESQLLRDLMTASAPLLSSHPVNRKRIQEGKAPANAIWPWGQGRPLRFPTLQDRFGLSGVVISAVDLVRGLGAAAGLSILRVPGVTGYLDTNYKGKVDAALEALRNGDTFVFLHIEAPDEAGHSGDPRLKIRAIEDFDAQVIGPLCEGLPHPERTSLLVISDHPTPCAIRTHTADPVPFLMTPRSEARRGARFTEAYAASTGVYLAEGHRLLERLLETDSASAPAM